jgi:hypothetical protein
MRLMLAALYRRVKSEVRDSMDCWDLMAKPA